MQTQRFNDPHALEQTLARQVEQFYRSQLGHQPDQVTCCFLRGKELVVTVENALTQPEQLLIASGYWELAGEVRISLNQILKPRIKAMIEKVTQETVIDLLSDIQPATRRNSLIAILKVNHKTATSADLS